MIVTLLFLQQRKDKKLTYMSAWMVLPMLSRHGTSCLSHLLAVSIFYTLYFKGTFVLFERVGVFLSLQKRLF